MALQTALPLLPKNQQPQSQRAASVPPAIPLTQPPAALPKFRRRPPHSARCPNATQSKSAALSAKSRQEIRADFQPHPRKHSCRELSSRKKLPGGNRASAAKEKSAACRRRLLKMTPVSGTARSRLPRVL